MKRTSVCSGFFLTGFALFVCFQVFAAPSKTGGFVGSVRDAAGQNVPCIFNQSRVIVLAPNLAQIVMDLGAGDTLVGVAGRPYWKAEHPAKDVGPFTDPAIEKILSLKPGLIISLRQGTPKKVHDQLGRISGAKIFAADLTDLNSVEKTYQDLGCLLGRTLEAKKLIDTFHDKMESVTASLRKKTTSVKGALLLLSMKPIMAMNQTTFTSSVLSRVGIDGLKLPHKKDYPELDHEWVERHKPGHVFLFCHDKPDTIPKEFVGVPLTPLSHEAWIQPSFHITEALEELDRALP